MNISVEELYGDPSVDDETIEAALNRSLNPRPSTMLYDKMGELGLAAHHYVLDIGSRDARHTCELARRYGCRLLGVELVQANLARAEQVIAEQQMAHQVQSVYGRIESIPAEDAIFDYIWCRDMLNHVSDLGAGLAECARVLKPGGQMLIYQTFATDLLEPNEAERLYSALAVVAQNMSTAYFEQTAQVAGFTVVERDVISSEWREWWEEHDERTTSRQLLYIARLRRDRERLMRELGRVGYAAELANAHWGVYQMLGKLCPMLFVLRLQELEWREEVRQAAKAGVITNLETN
jgi:ubiquinone/menaquinone biosynthesis C-methylase UbiE